MPVMVNRDGAAPAQEERVRRFRNRFRLFVTLPFLLFLTLMIFGTVVNYIPSDSMLPGLRPGDRILTLRGWLAYPFRRMPARGDVVTFRIKAERLGGDYGESMGEKGDTLLIKRVIGLPGDTIQVSAEGKVTLNGRPFEEPWAVEPDDPNLTPDAYPYAVNEPIRLRANELFVLGDNRKTSDDGRYWGALKRSEILGRYFFYLYNQPVKDRQLGRRQ